MEKDKYRLLVSLAKDIGNATALKYLIQNESNINVKEEQFKCICKCNPLLACDIMDSCYDESHKLSDLLLKICVNKFLEIDLHNTGKYYLNLLYYSMLYNCKIDEACAIVEAIIKKNNNKSDYVFSCSIFSRYFNDIWITAHLLILIKYDLKNDINNFLRILREKKFFEIDKQIIVNALKIKINEELNIKNYYIRIIRMLCLDKEFINEFKKYINGEFGPINFEIFKRITFSLFCEENGYNEFDYLVILPSSAPVTIRDEYLSYMKNFINDGNKQFLSSKLNVLNNMINDINNKNYERFMARYSYLLKRLSEINEISVMYNEKNELLELNNIGEMLLKEEFDFIKSLMPIYNQNLLLDKSSVSAATLKTNSKKIKEILLAYSLYKYENGKRYL